MNMDTVSEVAKTQVPNTQTNDISEIRRGNLRILKDRHSGLKLAQSLGLAQSSFISQMAGPRPTREVTEKTARTLEKELGLEPGAMDRPLGRTLEEKPVSAEQNIAMVSTVIRAVGNICTAESVDLPTNKLTDIIALAIVDAMEHGGNLREEHIRQVVRLLK
jgi:hypothetical protein